MLGRASLWIWVSGPGDFVTQEATAVDMGLCGFLDGRCFLLVLIRLLAGERAGRGTCVG